MYADHTFGTVLFAGLQVSEEKLDVVPPAPLGSISNVMFGMLTVPGGAAFPVLLSVEHPEADLVESRHVIADEIDLVAEGGLLGFPDGQAQGADAERRMNRAGERTGAKCRDRRADHVAVNLCPLRVLVGDLAAADRAGGDLVGANRVRAKVRGAERVAGDL